MRIHLKRWSLVLVGACCIGYWAYWANGRVILEHRSGDAVYRIREIPHSILPIFIFFKYDWAFYRCEIERSQGHFDAQTAQWDSYRFRQVAIEANSDTVVFVFDGRRVIAERTRPMGFVCWSEGTHDTRTSEQIGPRERVPPTRR